MTPTNYQQNAIRTNPEDYNPIRKRLDDSQTAGLLHAAMGMGTEAGEFSDQLKKHIFYGRELDEINLREEIGDLLWYCALACHYLGYDMGNAMKQNIAKLQERFPEKFTEKDANTRDTDKEMTVFQEERPQTWHNKFTYAPGGSQNEAAQLLRESTEEINRYRKAFYAAKAFIESHAADPDITAEMTEKYEEYQEASKGL